MAVWIITSCLWTLISADTTTFEVNVTAYDLKNSFIENGA